MTMKIALLIALAVFAAWALESHGSDPAGTWSKCANQVGDIIIVEGPRCPKGWRKVY